MAIVTLCASCVYQDTIVPHLVCLSQLANVPPAGTVRWDLGPISPPSRATMQMEAAYALLRTWEACVRRGLTVLRERSSPYLVMLVHTVWSMSCQQLAVIVWLDITVRVALYCLIQSMIPQGISVPRVTTVLRKAARLFHVSQALIATGLQTRMKPTACHVPLACTARAMGGPCQMTTVTKAGSAQRI